MHRFLFFLALALLLSGCSGPRGPEFADLNTASTTAPATTAPASDAAPAPPHVLWSIGDTDQSGREFRSFGNESALGATLPGGFVYRVGANTPADWPYIQPGPIDLWAGSALHPFTVEFDIEAAPTGLCTLVVDLVAAHGSFPPTLAVKINDWETALPLRRGPGDDALHEEKAKDPHAERIEFSPGLLRAGSNTITLTATGGSWILYDALRLEVDTSGRRPAPASLAAARPSIRLIESNGRLGQIVLLSARGFDRETKGTLDVACGSHRATRTVVVPFGQRDIPITVPAVDGPTTATFTLSVGDAVSRMETLLRKPRRWVVYVCPSVHTDIGYTDAQPLTMARHNDNFDIVLDMCMKNPDLRWNSEVAWELENYFSDRSTTQTAAAIELMKSGRIGLTATYLNLLTALMGDEDMNRVAYCAADLSRRHGIDMSAALLTDVPSATWGLVSTLADSGVRYFAQGCNPTRGPMAIHSGIREPVYWEGPDGARVLAWFNTMGYAQSAWLAQAKSVDDLERRLAPVLQAFADGGYPYDEVQLYGAFSDNQPVDPAYDDLVAEWNGSHAYPKIVFATAAEYFREIEKRHGDAIPVKRGDCGAFWEDGAGSTAQATAIHRDNQQNIVAAETLWSMAGLSGAPEPYPFDRIEAAWKDILFYDEHTWGAAESIGSPDSPRTIEQWTYKSEFATRPGKAIPALVEEGLAAYVSRVPAKANELVVVNTLSWPRAGLVTLPPSPIAGLAHPTDPTDPTDRADRADPTDSPGGLPQLVNAQGQAVPVHKVGGEWVAWIPEVPGFGASVFRGEKRTTKPEPDGEDVKPTPNGPGVTRLQNEFYTIRLDERGIVGIVDRESATEIVDASSPHAFGQILYASGGTDTRTHECNPALPEPVVRDARADEDPLKPPKGTILLSRAAGNSVERGESCPFYSEIIMRSSAPSMPDIETRVRLWNAEKRISLDVRIHGKSEIREKEAVYVAFPFATDSTRFRLGQANSVADPANDYLHGACHDWYCVQNFVAVDLRDGREAVWTSPDAPLVTLCDINRGRWDSDARIANGTLFSYAMNNYWWTNYKAGQGGEFRFRYELTTRAEGRPDAEAERFGRAVRTPLFAALSLGASGTRPADLAVGGDVVGVALKRAQDGNGTILRLRNVDNKPAVATVSESRLSPAGASSAAALRVELDNRVETPIRRLAAESGRVILPLTAQQTATLRLAPTATASTGASGGKP